MINQFVWGSKFQRVKHSTMIADYTEGGLRMPDMKCTYQSLRLPWIGRLVDKNTWSFYPNKIFKKFGGLLFLLKCNYNANTLTNIPTFYREILTYASYIFMEPYSKIIIWNNETSN